MMIRKRRPLLLSVRLLPMLVLVALAALWVAVGQFNLAPLATGVAKRALGREVALTALRLQPGRWVGVQITGLLVANPAGQPGDFLSVPHAQAQFSLWPALRGQWVLRDVAVDGARISLARAPSGAPNWRFGAEEPPKAEPADVQGRTAEAAVRRDTAPLLLSAILRDAEVDIHTSSGATLRLRGENVALHTPDLRSPVQLEGQLSYNGQAMTLKAQAGPLAAFADGARPYTAEATLQAAPATLQFTGQMTDPLNLDGVTGTITFDTPSLVPVLRAVGQEDYMPAAEDIGLKLTGAVQRNGDLWVLRDGQGALSRAGGVPNPITEASMQLREGARGHDDTVDLRMGFRTLDLNSLLGVKQKGQALATADLPLEIDPDPGVTLNLQLSAEQLRYAALQAASVRLDGVLGPGRMAIRSFSLAYLGGTLSATGVAEDATPAGDGKGEGKAEGSGARQASGGRISGQVSARQLDVSLIRRLLQGDAFPMSGRLDGEFAVEGQGATLNAAALSAHASAVVAMRSGAIQRRAVELASTDLRSLFRRAEGMSPLICMAAIVDMRGGVGTVSPVRIRARDGTIVGSGRFDLNRHWLDVLISSESSTTSSFALDVPMRISGGFNAPTIAPAQWSPQGRALLAAGDDTSRLLPALQGFARSIPCLVAPRR